MEVRAPGSSFLAHLEAADKAVEHGGELAVLQHHPRQCVLQRQLPQHVRLHRARWALCEDAGLVVAGRRQAGAGGSTLEGDLRAPSNKRHQWVRTGQCMCKQRMRQQAAWSVEAQQNRVPPQAHPSGPRAGVEGFGVGRGRQLERLKQHPPHLQAAVGACRHGCVVFTAGITIGQLGWLHCATRCWANVGYWCPVPGSTNGTPARHPWIHGRPPRAQMQVRVHFGNSTIPCARASLPACTHVCWRGEVELLPRQLVGHALQLQNAPLQCRPLCTHGWGQSSRWGLGQGSGWRLALASLPCYMACALIGLDDRLVECQPRRLYGHQHPPPPHKLRFSPSKALPCFNDRLVKG